MIEDIDNTWLISDTHFGHANIERLCKRPANADALMVTEWQRLVPPDALLLHLGDVAYRAEFDEWATIIRALPGDKRLILGNHDKQPASYYERCGFAILLPFNCACSMASSSLLITTRLVTTSRESCVTNSTSMAISTTAAMVGDRTHPVRLLAMATATSAWR